MVRPSRLRSLVTWLRRAYQVSERRVCGATGFARSSHRYRATADPQPELRLRLKELAVARVRYGYRRLHVLLRREGWPINAKLGLSSVQRGRLEHPPQDAATPAFDPRPCWPFCDRACQ